MTDEAQIAELGGFNTGRLYAANGQPVFWARYTDGVVFFRDRARMIDGWLDRIPEINFSPRWIMAEYDAGRYGLAAPDYRMPPRTPADIDFGAPLKI